MLVSWEGCYRQVATDLGTARGRGRAEVLGRAEALAAGTGAAEIHRSAAPAPALPAKNQDRLQVEDNLDPPKPIRQVIPGLQQYEVKTVTVEPDKPSPSHWPEFALLVAVILMPVVGYAVWRRARHEGTHRAQAGR